mgnify:CR=1 FL=1
MPEAHEILKDAMALSPREKAELADKLLASLDEPDKELEALWASEVEDRLEAYTRGEIKSFALEEVLAKYK